MTAAVLWTLAAAVKAAPPFVAALIAAGWIERSWRA